MNYKTRCKVCGCMVFSVIFLTNYPACKNCFKKLEQNPDIINQDRSIKVSTNTAFSTITMQVSASTSSITTTQPPELL